MSRYLRKAFDAPTHMEVLPRLLEHTPRLADKVVCDFCGGDQVVYIYAADRMSTGVRKRCWRWMACKACAAAVEAGNWGVVEERAQPRLRRLFVDSAGFEPDQQVVKSAMRMALKEFWEWAVMDQG